MFDADAKTQMSNTVLGKLHASGNSDFFSRRGRGGSRCYLVEVLFPVKTYKLLTAIDDMLSQENCR